MSSIEFIDWRYSQSCWYFRPCRGIITAPSHAKLKVQSPPPPRHYCACVGGTYMLTCVHRFVLPTVIRPYKLNIHYTYSTLLPAFLFGCVVYTSATMANFVALFCKINLQYFNVRGSVNCSPV